MSTQEQARALMMRHHHIVKNRQQSMLNRTATEVGLDALENSIDDRNNSNRNNSDRPGTATN
ncbi:hypothetical protein [Synechocystis sp. PCC 7509]|uniref:hypothetical protein n=1 Tax=Synechocystis sp. PCC 7509 TaxID=927677 RepID=UPI0002AD015A|nr:hypothetical protein [Synechocystis sp. PCC 7509]